MAIIGIRAETKGMWERRTPLTPKAAESLVREGFRVLVQLSPIRIFPSKEYRKAGAEVVTELGDRAKVVFGVKEIPYDVFRPNTTYVFFSHTYKGQPGNMHMLNAAMAAGTTLIDYERIVDQNNQRLVAFGNFAGMAGLTDTLNLLGLRLTALGFQNNPFAQVKQTINYREGLPEIKEQLRQIGDRIRSGGVPEEIGPIVFGFLGYGRVGRGAIEVFDALQPVEIKPFDLLIQGGSLSRNQIYKVIFTEKDTVRHREKGSNFEVEDYWFNPKSFELYKRILSPYLPRLTVLINGILWNRNQPVLITQENLKEASAGRLRVIGDISCDPFPNGPIAATVRATTVEDPYFVYNPQTGKASDGWTEPGIAVMAVDNLPCELPRESSEYFSNSLLPFVGRITRAKYNQPYEEGILSLPEEVRPAVILWQGRLAPPYADNKEIVEGLKNYGHKPFHHDW